MNSREYWLKREELKLSEALKDAEELEKKIKKAYVKANQYFEKEINNLFQKYSKDNELTFAEANKNLTSKEFKQWRMDLQDYIKEIEGMGDDKLLLELNTLSTKSRISRLEELKYQLGKHIDVVYETIESGTEELLKGSVKDNYYKTTFNIHQFKGFGTSFAFVDEKMVEELLSYPWSGADFRTRIKVNREAFKRKVGQELTQMIIRGEGSKKVAKRLQHVSGASFNDSIRVINTEHSYICNQADKLSYNKLDVEKYEFVATLDKRTSKTCQALDGKVEEVEKAVVGENYPPMHPFCRSTTIPYIENRQSTRFARDNKGKRIEVPSSMKYEEWKEIYNIK